MSARLVVDGEDGLEGRGLLVLSALHLVARDLQGIAIRVLGAGDPAVATAIEVLRCDTGLDVAAAPPDADPARELAGAALFVAVVARTTAHLPLVPGVRRLCAVQFPGPDATAAELVLMRAAHDPRVLGRRIIAALRRGGP